MMRAEMDVLALMVRAVLACTLTIAGIAKVFDIREFQKTLAGLGTPKPLIGIGSRAVPLIELVVGAMLIPAGAVTFGAWSATVLFAVFTLVVGIHYLWGRPVECRCFGQLHSARIGLATVVRNLTFTALAVLLVVSQDRAALSFFTPSRAALSITLAMAGVLVAAFIVSWKQRKTSPPEQTRAAASALQDIPQSGLPVGSLAPGFDLVDLSGRRRSLDDLLLRRLPVVLVFVSPGCPTCEALLPDIEKWNREFSARVTVAVVSAGSLEESDGKFERTDLKCVLLDGMSTGDAYDVQWIPGAVRINPDGTIGSLIANKAEDIRKLIQASEVGK
jgi:uncharacterized membrane protein YphA (DoxX/SURF4 family)/thiol-disulfide isomerase/thioredoxin